MQLFLNLQNLCYCQRYSAKQGNMKIRKRLILLINLVESA